jgi:hypothetical protein
MVIFKDIKVGGLFITGPGDHMFIKIAQDSDNPSAKSYGSTNTIQLHDGRQLWTPSNRQVSEPKKRDFVTLGERHDWENISKVAA